MDNSKRGPASQVKPRPAPRGRPLAKGYYKPRPAPRGRPLAKGYYKPKPAPRGRPSSPGMKKPTKKSPNIFVILLGIVVLVMVGALIWVSFVGEINLNLGNSGDTFFYKEIDLKISKVLVEGDLVKVTIVLGEGDSNLDQLRFIIETLYDREIFIEEYSGTKEFFLNLDILAGEDIQKLSVYPIFRNSDGFTYSGDLADSYTAF